MAAPIASSLFLLGGAASAAFAVVRHSSSKRESDTRPSSDVLCPSTPSTPCPHSAAGWLRGAESSSPSKKSGGSTETGHSPTVTAVSVPQEAIPMRALEAGSLICFYTSLGELVTVKKEGKAWDLHACLAPSPPDAEGNDIHLQRPCFAHGDQQLSTSRSPCQCTWTRHATPSLQAVSGYPTSLLRQSLLSPEMAAR